MTFDPYQQWLNIPPGRRPPSAHTLLGLADEETDPERIEEAFSERYQHVRRYALSGHAAAASRLLAELADAVNRLTQAMRTDWHAPESVTGWLTAERTPVDCYELLNLPCFTSDRQRLLEAIHAARTELQTARSEHTPAERLGQLLGELDAAENALSGSRAYWSYHSDILARLDREYARASVPPAKRWRPGNLQEWLTDQGVDSRQVEMVARAMLAPQDEAREVIAALCPAEHVAELLPDEAIVTAEVAAAGRGRSALRAAWQALTSPVRAADRLLASLSGGEGSSTHIALRVLVVLAVLLAVGTACTWLGAQLRHWSVATPPSTVPRDRVIASSPAMAAGPHNRPTPRANPSDHAGPSGLLAVPPEPEKVEPAPLIGSNVQSTTYGEDHSSTNPGLVEDPFAPPEFPPLPPRIDPPADETSPFAEVIEPTLPTAAEQPRRPRPRILGGHIASIRSLSFRPTGAMLAAAAEDGTMICWALPTGRIVRTVAGHQGCVTSLAFSADGSLLASAGEDHAVRLWDIAAGQMVDRFFDPRTDFYSVAFSPVADIVVFGGGEGTLWLWNLGRRRAPEVIPDGDYRPGAVLAVAISPDGTTLASGYEDHRIKLWRLAGHRRQKVLSRHNDAVTSLVFGPNGDYLASASRDNTVRLWDLESKGQRYSFDDHDGAVTSVDFSPDGGTLASGCEDGRVRIWDVATGRLQTSVDGGGAVHAVAFSPDGLLLAAGNEEGAVRLWETETLGQ